MKHMIRYKIICLTLSFLVTITGCSNTDISYDTSTIVSSVSDHIVNFADDLGNNITIDTKKELNIAVLSGSLAQAWELAGGDLSAVTDDYFDNENTEKNSVVSVGSLRTPSLEKLVDLEIDYAILSASILDQVGLGNRLEELGIEPIFFEVEHFDDYDNMMKIFTDMTGRKDLYDKHVADIKDDILQEIGRVSGDAPQILLLRSYSTGVKAKGSDSMTGQMLMELGCINIADIDSGLFDNLSMEAIVVADPEYIFVTTMGDEDAAMEMLKETFLQNPLWSSLQAVENAQYYILEKDLFQNKPNDRWGESYKILANILYGD